MLGNVSSMYYYQIMYTGTQPYDLDTYITHHGDGSNFYRGEDFAQPQALRDGDTLSNGWQIAGDPFPAVNGSVGLTFTNGETRIVAPGLPLQLNSDRKGLLPGQLAAGHILETGCVVLAEPVAIGSAGWHNGQQEVKVELTGGWEGHEVGTPDDLPLAVFDEVFPPSADTTLGSFALERTLGMHEIARRNLPQLGQLALDLQIPVIPLTGN